MAFRSLARSSLTRNVTALVRPSIAPLVAGHSRALTTARLVNSENENQSNSFNMNGYYIMFGVIGGGLLMGFNERNTAQNAAKPTKVGDYDAVRKVLEAMMDDDAHDDGSRGPLLVRLAWHAAGTFDRATCTGGSNGATMRFSPESADGANAGLNIARNWLEPVKAQFPWITYADLWTLAGCVAIEAMGGPKVAWRPGRTDAPSGKHCPPVGRLPDAAQGQDHIRDVFYRMGFNDQEIVALIGAHAMGRCHTDRSGFDGPWTNAPTTFSNEFFRLLLESKWTPRKWNGPFQYEDETKQLMMLPSDLALVKDPAFKVWVQRYAKDEELFSRDFAKSFAKLMELGVPVFKN